MPASFRRDGLLTPCIQSRGCYKLTSVTIPKSVTKIGKEAFSMGYNLKMVQYTGTKAQWKQISKAEYSFSDHVIVRCSDGDIMWWE